MYSQDYLQSLPAKAQSRNLPVDRSEIDGLVGVTRRSEGEGFAGIVGRMNTMLFARWAGRREHLQPASSNVSVRLTFAEAARRFVTWMREMGFVGTYSDRELREYLAWWHADENVAPLAADLLVGKIVKLRLARRQRQRLKAVSGVDARTIFFTIDDDEMAIGRSRKSRTAHAPLSESREQPLRLAA
jgi:hypothetical protein